MIEESDGTSNSVDPHREPPPSLGMIAHIWAGQLGPLDVTDDADASDENGAIELPSQRTSRVQVD